MKLQEVTLYENRSHRILKEGWQDLTEAQQKYQLRYEKELWPLVETYVRLLEQELSPKQIQKIFTSAEQVMNATGKNQTALGKAGTLAKDTVKKINAKIDELGKMAKDSGPVKNADAKFAQLKKDIAAKAPDNKVVQGVQKISDWAKENPGKASLAVGILTTIAAFAGGPAGGLAAGMILRGTKDLLQGADLSTAAGKAIKTGALGALIGLGVQGLGDAIEGAAEYVKDTLNPNYMRASWDYMETVNGVPGDWADARLVGYPDDIEPVREAWDKAVEALQNDDYATFEKEWAVIEDAVDKFNSEEYQASLEGTREARKEWAEGIAAFSKMADGVAAAAQGAAQTADDKKESIDLHSEYEKYLQEAGFADMIKKGGAALGKAAAAGAAKVKQGAKAVGKELGQQVTTRKLNKLWSKAGEPTDMASIINILQQAGVPEEQIGTVGKQANVNITRSNANDVDPELEKLASEIKTLGLVDILKPRLADG
jgi:hypothetical protein